MRKVKKKVYTLQGWILTGIVSLCLFLSACGISENIDTADQFENTIGVEDTSEVIAEESKEEGGVSQLEEMQVHFIDVGQGDATLITCGDETMLIDTGDNSKGTTVQLYLNKQGITKLDYLVLTHTDADHFGGADVIITKYDINHIFLGDYEKDNKTYEELMRALDTKGYKWSTPVVGSTYTLGSANFTIIAPNKIYDDPNNASIGLILQNGSNKFLFTEDAEEEAEADILANGLDIDCDVLKAGHHGSKTASTQEFLDAASPDFAVISCGEDNSYGHPHAEPMNSFRSMGMKLFRTDEQGSIVATSDGEGITWNCSPTDSWVAGESTQSAKSSLSEAKGESSSSAIEALEESSINTVTPPEEGNVVESEKPIEITPTQSNESLTNGGSFAVNGKNGKIHMVGACPATGDGSNAMDNPIYFNSYEEAEAKSISIDGGLEKRKCGNCW